METLSFAYGMLSVIAIAAIVIVVMGMLKVFKMQDKINTIERWLSADTRDLHSRITNLDADLCRTIENDRKEINHRVDALNSYVDSRFDKMENKFIGNSAKKQIIND